MKYRDRSQGYFNDTVLAQTLDCYRSEQNTHGGNGKSPENRNVAGSGAAQGQTRPILQDERG
eukprot:15160882-Heterocapsa_arctica.AAC.1